MVLFWSPFMTHFLQTGLIFNIETSKSFSDLVLVSVVFLGLFLVSHLGLFGSHFGHQNGLIWSRLGLFWVSHKERLNKTKKDPNKTVETAIRPKEDSFKTRRRPTNNNERLRLASLLHQCVLKTLNDTPLTALILQIRSVFFA
jgi:hypothetical protein